jgi:hypothetical protein
MARSGHPLRLATASFLFCRSGRRCGQFQHQAVIPAICLSDDPEFAAPLESNRVTFIGPPPQVRRQVADATNNRLGTRDHAIREPMCLAMVCISQMTVFSIVHTAQEHEQARPLLCSLGWKSMDPKNSLKGQSISLHYVTQTTDLDRDSLRHLAFHILLNWSALQSVGNPYECKESVKKVVLEIPRETLIRGLVSGGF